MSRFSVVASRSGQSRMVGRYETFEDACRAAGMMISQGNGLGFHVRYNILCDDKEFFWVNSDAIGSGELVELLDEWDQLDGLAQEEKRDWVRAALKDGRLVATGEAVGIIPPEE